MMAKKPKSVPTSPPTEPTPATPYQPTEAERAVAAKFFARQEARPVARVKVEIPRAGAPVEVSADHVDSDVGGIALVSACGTTSTEFFDFLLGHLLNGLHEKHSAPIDAKKLNAGLAVLTSLEPHDELEAMLIAQMVVTHDAAMDMLRQCRQTEYAPAFDRCGNMATKLLRTYTAQLEALKRYRSKGEQVVRVVHQNVTVQADKAVVGVTGSGGGVDEKTRGQPHALTHAPGTTLPSAIEANREAVPVASG